MPIKEIAPEEQQERDGGHEPADADARAVQFNIDADKTDHEQQTASAGDDSASISSSAQFGSATWMSPLKP